MSAPAAKATVLDARRMDEAKSKERIEYPFLDLCYEYDGLEPIWFGLRTVFLTIAVQTSLGPENRTARHKGQFSLTRPIER
jgi:hypothetical protein